MTVSGTTGASATATIASLNGIRALAVLLVFFAHSGLEKFIPGGLGVTVFFVLSGFLITTLMRIEHEATDRIDFLAFYLRRFLRLMPPLTIIVCVAAMLAWLSIIDGRYTIGGFAATLFYFGNYYVIAHDFAGIPDGLGVVWSLAVEEHYYLLYPPLAALLLHLGRKALATSVLASLCVLILLWRYWLVAHGASEDYLTMATDARADAILVGCILALRWNPVLQAAAVSRPWHDASILVLCFVTLLFTLVYRDESFRLTLRMTLQSVAIAPLIYLSVARAHQAPFRWLNWAPLVYLGSISYTVYLSHHLILRGLARHWPHLPWIWLLVSGALLTWLLAEAMRRWVEMPCAKLRRRLHHERARAARTGAQLGLTPTPLP